MIYAVYEIKRVIFIEFRIIIGRSTIHNILKENEKMS